MQEYVITTDNGCDFSRELAEKINVDIVNLSVLIDGQEYDGVEKKIDLKEVYGLMKKGVQVTTSQVNPEKAENFFEKYLSKGVDVIHIALSGQISGTYNSCKIAAVNLAEKYPERKLTVIDSISASLGLGLLVMQAIKEKESGKSYNEVVDFIQQRKGHICHMFTVGDLVYLQRSGRISKAEVVIGSLIGIKPVLNADSHGRLISISKSRGRKNSLIELVEYMQKLVGNNKNEMVTISHGNCLEDAEFVANLIKEKFPDIKDVIICELGPVIGSHSGPGTLALFFIGDHRINK